jgi:hypothetical protein
MLMTPFAAPSHRASRLPTLEDVDRLDLVGLMSSKREERVALAVDASE